MNLKDAFVRAVRTAAAVFVATVTIVAPAADLAGIQSAAVAQATSALGALLFAVSSGLVTFIMNAAEDNTRFQLPK